MSETATSWTPKPSARKEAIATIERGLRVANVLPRGGKAVDVVAGFGRLERMRLAADLARLGRLVLRKTTLVETALSAFDFSALEKAALDYGVAAPDLVEEGRTAKRAEARVLRALALRDRADQLVGGATALLGRPPELDRESRMFLDEFDGVVRPALFHVIPLNAARLTLLDSVAPAERARLWWYAQGADLAPTGLDALAQAAEVIFCFPEAATDLEELRQAESALQNLAREAVRCRDMVREHVKRGEFLVLADERTLESQRQTATQSRSAGPDRRR
jgi:hypothetical protein